MGLKHPIENGVISNWEDMEEIWTHIFHELHATFEEHPVLVTDCPSHSDEDREEMARWMFCNNVPALAIITAAELALYASNRTTGIVIDFGCNVTHVVPIYDGAIVKDAVQKLDIGGKDLTGYLIKLLMEERGYAITTNGEIKIVETEVKEKWAYVALDFEQEMRDAAVARLDFEKDIRMPKSWEPETLKVGSELWVSNKLYLLFDHSDPLSRSFQISEALFKPALLERESPGIHEMIYDAITRCGTDIQSQMWGNVVLTGGTSMLRGLADRLEKELGTLAPPSTIVGIVAPEDGRNNAWKAGSIIADQSTRPIWWTKGEYEEFGQGLVHHKRTSTLAGI